MAIELPNLDTRTWAELSDWMKERIPLYNGQWTDYNFSDPGITLIELLAWVGETLLYRLNRISDEALHNDMLLLAGVAGDKLKSQIQALSKNNMDLNYLAYLEYLSLLANPTNPRDQLEMQRATLAFIESPYLTLTLADLEALGMEVNRTLAAPQQVPGQPVQMPFAVGRAIARANGDGLTLILAATVVVTYFTPVYAQTLQQKLGSGYLLVKIANPPDSSLTANYKSLIASAVAYLTPRKPVGVQLMVGPPDVSAVNVSIQMTSSVDADPKLTVTLIAAKITAYLDPYVGGPDGTGWPYDVAPKKSALLSLCLETPGTASVQSLELDFYPTIVVGEFATLSLNTKLGPQPSDATQAPFKGLPRLNYLEIACAASLANDEGEL